MAESKGGQESRHIYFTPIASSFSAWLVGTLNGVLRYVMVLFTASSYSASPKGIVRAVISFTIKDRRTKHTSRTSAVNSP